MGRNKSPTNTFLFYKSRTELILNKKDTWILHLIAIYYDNLIIIFPDGMYDNSLGVGKSDSAISWVTPEN